LINVSKKNNNNQEEINTEKAILNIICLVDFFVLIVFPEIQYDISEQAYLVLFLFWIFQVFMMI